MVVDDNPQSFPPGPNECNVGLVSSVAWPKEIVAWNLCSSCMSSVFTASPSPKIMIMRIKQGCGETDTLVFRKPGFLGWWYNDFNFDFAKFWTVFAGKEVIFTWLAD